MDNDVLMIAQLTAIGGCAVGFLVVVWAFVRVVGAKTRPRSVESGAGR